MSNNHIGCAYLKPVMVKSSWRQTISKVTREIKKSNLIFDSIAFTGMSGALVAPTVAGRLNKSLLMVRKLGDGSHSGMLLEGNPNTDSFIIVDDLMSSCSTVQRILRQIKKNDFTRHAKCVGIFLYAAEQSRTSFTFVSPSQDEKLEIPVFDLISHQDENNP